MKRMHMQSIRLAVLVGSTAIAVAFRSSQTIQPLKRGEVQPILVSRKEAVTSVLSSFVTLVALATPLSNANAFDNKVSTKYDDRPKRRGAKPPDLGVMVRKDIVGTEYQGLKHCGAAPNCFVTTDDVEDDPDHNIPPWIWPIELGNDQEKAFELLASVIDSYKPGQSNVDGGGFKIITNDPRKGYIYTQFESLKNGYIDDLELAFITGSVGGDRAVQVRSSSRIGYLDYGVNAKRLNYIAKDLRAMGWDAPGVEYKTHQNYVIQNEIE
jgi:uncharacterized protein (DUF1499 family)